MRMKTIERLFTQFASGGRFGSPALVVNTLLVASFLLTVAFYSWPAALIAPLWVFLLFTCWLETRRAGRCAAEVETQRTRLAPYVSAIPALIFQLRETAYHLEAAVLHACDGFDSIRVRAGDADRDQNLEREIRRVIVALQFEDIVNQRICQAVDTLHRLEADLTSCVDSRRMASTGDRVMHALDRSLPRPMDEGRAFKKSFAESINENAVELFLPEVGS
jgi:hypothetical protein